MRKRISKATISSIILLLVISSCSERRIRDVTKNIHFSNYCPAIPSDSLVQLTIKKIELFNVERFPNMWTEGGIPMSLHVEVNNTTKKKVVFSTVSNDPAMNSNFVGIVSSDTISFYHSLLTNEDFQVVPDSLFTIQLTCIGGAFEDLFDYDDHGDNREPMYKILSNMCFFYETDRRQDIVTDDSIMLCKKRNLHIDKNVRVITNSRIR